MYIQSNKCIYSNCHHGFIVVTKGGQNIANQFSHRYNTQNTYKHITHLFSLPCVGNKCSFTPFPPVKKLRNICQIPPPPSED